MPQVAANMLCASASCCILCFAKGSSVPDMLAWLTGMSLPVPLSTQSFRLTVSTLLAAAAIDTVA